MTQTKDDSLNQVERKNIEVILRFLLICQIVAIVGSVSSFAFGLKWIPFLSFCNFILWTSCRYFYKTYKFFWAQLLFVLTTNFSVINYTFCFGFDMGWYFYFFTSTLSMFVFLRTDNSKLLNVAIASYVVNFLFLFVWFVYLGNRPANELDGNVVKLLFAFNFPLAYYMCFVLVKYFINLDKIRTLQSSQLLFKKERIENENKQLELFNYIVSHNLRGPISRISGLANLLEVNSEENKEVLNYIKESVENVDQVITDLNLILTNKKKSDEALSMLNIVDLVSLVKKDLNHEICKTEIDFVENFKVKEFKGVKGLWYSILYNLISNAVKYRSNDRKPMIEISLKKANNNLLFQCRDNGVGIDLNRNRTKLFQLYSRFNNEVQGKGIGLYLVQNHVEHLGGEITVESELGVGTSFFITFQENI